MARMRLFCIYASLLRRSSIEGHHKGVMSVSVLLALNSRTVPESIETLPMIGAVFCGDAMVATCGRYPLQVITGFSW